jgi:hypothetical protein
VIKDDLESARIALEAAARGFDAAECSGTDAVTLLIELGSIRHLADGLVGKVARRAEDTAAHTYGTDRNAAELCSRLVGAHRARRSARLSSRRSWSRCGDGCSGALGVVVFAAG